jgi:hypothetical protein
VVVVNPGMVLGPVIPPGLNASMLLFCNLFQVSALFVLCGFLVHYIVMVLIFLTST